MLGIPTIKHFCKGGCRPSPLEICYTWQTKPCRWVARISTKTFSHVISIQVFFDSWKTAISVEEVGTTNSIFSRNLFVCLFAYLCQQLKYTVSEGLKRNIPIEDKYFRMQAHKKCTDAANQVKNQHTSFDQWTSHMEEDNLYLLIYKINL